MRLLWHNAVGAKEFCVGVTSVGFGDRGPAICPASRQLYDCGVDNSCVNTVFSPQELTASSTRPRARGFAPADQHLCRVSVGRPDLFGHA